MMSRKHFVAVAAILKEKTIETPAAGFDEGFASATEEIAGELATFFKSENPNFNRSKFLTACGLKP